MPLSREQRKALPDSDFAVPARRTLPIPDERHVRMAWSQLDRTTGLDETERAEARTRIKTKAHELGLDTSGWEMRASTGGLYVRRNLIGDSAAAFVAWAKSQGFVNVMPADQLHVTIVHSAADVVLSPLDNEVIVSGGDRDVFPLGDGGAIVLRFHADELQARWQEARTAGAEGYDAFLSHVTVSWGGEPTDNLDNVVPFDGDLVFGPEIHEPLKADWAKEQGMRMEAQGFLLEGQDLEAMALAMPDVKGHPNRMPFSGVLTRLNSKSDRPPGGSNGRHVVLTTKAAERALPSLLGMGVDFTPSFDGHDATRKIGVITAANIQGDAIHVDGFIYARDFPAEASRIQTDKALLGFSWELADIYVESLDADPLVITDAYFTGAAILRKDKAAYQSTSLAASAEDPDMTKEEIAAAVGEAIAGPMKTLADGMAALAAASATSAELLTSMQAAAAKTAAEKAEADAKAADEAKAGELEALKTKVADLEAAAANKTEAPARKTLSPQITALLAKADLSMPKGDEKLNVGVVDAALAKSGLTPVKRIEIKNELERAGAL